MRLARRAHIRPSPSTHRYIKTNTAAAKVLMKYARRKGYLLDGRLSNLSKRHFAQVYTDTSLSRPSSSSGLLYIYIHISCLVPSSTSLCRPFGCHPKRINILTVLWANTNRAESAKYFNLSGTPIHKVSTSSGAHPPFYPPLFHPLDVRVVQQRWYSVPGKKYILIKFPAWEYRETIKENRKGEKILKYIEFFMYIPTINVSISDSKM